MKILYGVSGKGAIATLNTYRHHQARGTLNRLETALAARLAPRVSPSPPYPPALR